MTFPFFSFLIFSSLFLYSPGLISSPVLPTACMDRTFLLPLSFLQLCGVVWRSYPLRARSYGVVLPTQTATPSPPSPGRTAVPAVPARRLRVGKADHGYAGAH